MKISRNFLVVEMVMIFQGILLLNRPSLIHVFILPAAFAIGYFSDLLFGGNTI